MSSPSDSQSASRPRHPVRLERSGGIATVLIDNPPVNALGAAVRQGIFLSIEAADADPAVHAILIAASGRTFPAGADITEFGKPPQDPALGQLCTRIEACTKPVFAALFGTVLGGGLEVAMAAHYRIAVPGTQLGLPEVKLGILPGAGGTQRAPRLIGLEASHRMIATGAPVSAEKALEMGLIDAIDPDPRGAARALAEEGMPVRRSGDDRSKLADAKSNLALLQKLRADLKGVRGPHPARTRIVDCLEAALLLPIEAGLARERDAFEECVVSPDSLGLRHIFLAQRRAAKFPELDGGKGSAPEHVAIVGGGLMGSGIALACLAAGLQVTVVEAGEAGVTAALDQIGEGLQTSIAKGKLSETAGAQALNRIKLTANMADIAEADFVIETVTEKRSVKQDVLARIGALARPGAVIATNSSYQDPEVLAQATGRAEDFVGLHFFAPAHIMPLVEIGVGHASHREAVVTAHALAKRLGKVPVRSAATPAFIVNRILAHYRLVADAIMEDGATAEAIDTAMRRFGFALGPYQVLDRSGLDISFAMRQNQPRDPARRYVEIGDLMVAQGWLGRKAGRGYYVYGGESPQPNPEVTELTEALRLEKGQPAQSFSEREIQRRLLLAMINEGARLLEDEVAARPSDIDLCLVKGLGFPDLKGGPMHQADQLGTFAVAQQIARYAEAEPDLWQTAPLLQRLARERGTFSSLN